MSHATTAVLLLTVAMLGCGRSPAPVAMAAPPPAPPPVPVRPAEPDVTRPPLPTDGSVNVRFTHTGGDTWSVDYAFSEPVHALAFRRRRTLRGDWRVVEPPGAKLVGRFVVAAEPFRRLRIALPTTSAQPDKEYRPFYRYANRGVLAYTGQLAVAQAKCNVADCAGGEGLSVGPDYAGQLALVAADGERVVVYGRSPASGATVSLDGDGTYAYFGALAPVETPEFVGVLDGGMPEWMRRRVSTDSPALFAFYARRLGPLDEPKPTVFLTFAPRDRGVSLGGGVLRPHLVTLDLELERAKLDESPQTLLDIDRLVAHEAAHFWNADQHSSGGDPGEAWLVEGGADALAARVLHATGVLDDTAYRETLAEAASECALWLSGGEPLTASTRPGHSRAFYVCGSTLQLVVEAAVRRRDPGADLFTFWRAVFDEGRPRYGEATFLGVLDRLARAPAVTAAIRRLIHEPQEDPTRSIREVLHLAGLETTLLKDGTMPAEYQQHASIPEMDALLSRPCARALTFDGDVEVRPAVGADGACPGLGAGDVLDEVAGVQVGRRGASSFQRADAMCRAHHTVDVTTAKGAHVVVPCEPKARTAPAYFELVRAP